jgi:hypothetical protein
MGRLTVGFRGGGGGIRTRGGLLTPTRFPGVRLKPLIHPSGEARILVEATQWPVARALLLINAIAVPMSAETSLMLPGTIIVLFFCARCA